MPNNPKRILIFSLTYLPLIGGAELAVKEITDRLRDYQFDLITLKAHPDMQIFEAVGNVHVYRIGNGLGYIQKILFIPRAAWQAFKLHKKRPYNRFWAIMTNMVFPIALLRIFGNRTPHIVTIQDGDPIGRVFGRLRIKFFSPLLKYGFKHAIVVQVISSFLKEWPKQVGYKGRVVVVPNGVDIQKFFKGSKTIKSSEVVLISTSRLTKKNGLVDVIRAMQFLPANIKFWIIGTGELKDDLKLEASKVEGRVRFLGAIKPEDVPSFLHEADIFIRPSLSEGFGSSFVEAMAAGLPVIATPVGGIKDFVFDPEKDKDRAPTGFFVEVNNPKMIAKTVEKILKDARLRGTVVVNAQKMVKEKYDWNIIADQMKRLVFEPNS